MKIKIKDHGFNLSKGFEFAPHTDKREQLFKDYGFEYEIIEVSGEKQLSWDENKNHIEIPFLDIFRCDESIKEFLEKYECELVLDGRSGIVLKLS